MGCCDCTTTWSCEESDLIFKVQFIDQNYYTPSRPGINYNWHYSVGIPNPPTRIIGVYPAVKSKRTSGPTSSCNCTDDSGGDIVSDNLINADSDIGGDYDINYQGYWKNPATNHIVYGQAQWRGYRFYDIKIRQVDYQNSHKCGPGCPGGSGNWEWDDLEARKNECENLTPY